MMSEEDRLAWEAEYLRKRSEWEPEDEITEVPAELQEAADTLQHDCGGGERVIRNTRTFGG